MKQNEKSKRWLSHPIFWAVSLFVILLLLAQLRIQFPAHAAEKAEDRYSDLQNFSKVLNLIQQYYVEETDMKRLIYGAIKGMLRELDPHSSFMTPEMYREFKSETSGQFGGLGVEIAVQNGILTVISPIEDTPAFHAGVKAGDKIIAIDGVSTKGLSLAEASILMKGKIGQQITLTMARENVDAPIDIPIVRGNVKVKSVKYTDMDDGFAYVKITSFIENTASELKAALEAHLQKKSKISGLLIDFRRNPGGLLDQAVKVSDLFLNEGVIVSTIGRNKAEKEVINASKTAPFTGFPIIILVNEYTASASEIVSGALQDNDRAVIVGERTFGKGSVQSVIELNDGSGLKMTVARYFTPKGISIQAEGITPDIEIDEVDAENFQKSVVQKSKSTREKDLDGHLKGDREKLIENQKKVSDQASKWWKDFAQKKDDKDTPANKLMRSDYQVYQAFNYLKSWRTFERIKKVN